jgi:hypothetical protein
MVTMRTDNLVETYLRRLEAAAAHMQPSRRAELVAEIREHIETALRQEDEVGEIAVRNVLERLGPPEEIVEAAEPPTEPGWSRARAGALEIVALVSLLVPVLGWLVGIVLVAVSRAWSNREKALGITLALLPLVLPLLVVMASAGGSEEMVPVEPQPGSGGLPEAGETSDPNYVVVLVLALLAGLPSALYLGWRLGRPAAPPTR